jgi:hypothetical protein
MAEHKFETKILNPYCSKCGQVAESCSFNAEIKAAKIVLNGEVAVIDVATAETVNVKEFSYLTLKCSNGHTWGREGDRLPRTGV